MIARAEHLPGINRLFGKPESRHSVSMSGLSFLRRIPEQTSREISEVTNIIDNLHPAGTSFTVVAVGESVRNVSKHYPVREVDLLVLNSAQPETSERQEAVEYVANSIKEGLEFFGHEVYESAPVHTEAKIPDGISIRTADEIPLHITVTGPHSKASGEFLKLEKKAREDMAVLLKSKAA